jgi:8-oxo-dGTP diphosphatase
MSDPVEVVAAVVRRDQEYLVCLRPAHKRHGGLWEFPGGKLDPGESLAEAARRELHEELAVEVVRVGPVLHRAHDPGSPFTIRFVEVEIRGDPVALEHDALVWAAPDGLLDLPLAPGDRAFVLAVLASG